MPTSFDQWVTRDSPQLSAASTKAAEQEEREWEWRLSLTINSNLDAKDSISKWYSAKVVGVRDPCQSHPYGELKISFDGWLSKYDEWIPRNSMRLARYQTYSLLSPTRDT